MQQWRPITVGTRTIELSQHGDVRYADTLKTINTFQHSAGYKVINVSGKTPYVHRLVYEAFHGPIPKGMQINHKDGIKDNPRLDNLEVVTPLENIHHAIRTGLMGNQGVNNGQAELNEHKVRRIRLMRDTGATFKLIGSIFGVATTHASNIYHRHRWNNLA